VNEAPDTDEETIGFDDLIKSDDLESPFRGIPHKPAGFIKDGTTMQTYVSEDMMRRLNKAAKKLGVSRSELIRTAVTTFMVDNGLWSLRGPERNRT
jgi:hypothetical protein